MGGREAGAAAAQSKGSARRMEDELQSATWRAAWLRWMDRWVDPGLLFLAASTIPLLIVETGSPTEADQQWLTIGNWVVWAGFALNFFVRIGIALDRRAEARALVWDLAVIVVAPAMIIIGAVVESGAALARLLVVVVRVVSRGALIRRAWRKLRLEPLRIVAGLVPFVWLLSAALVLRVEGWSASAGSITSIGDSLWWSAATLTTVGYGDVAPRSGAGRVIATMTMIVGIGMFSLVTAKLAEFLFGQRMARGRNEVWEHGHTVVLGWSPEVFTVVEELVLANDDRGGGVVAVLAEQDRGAMMREIDAHVPFARRSNTTIVCRTGSIDDPSDLRIVRPDRARAIIVVSTPGSESVVVKTLLALFSGEVGSVSAPVVAEIDEPASAAALRATFGERVIVVEPTSFIARAAAQACRSPAVALAYEELLTFGGSELYLRAQPEAVGRTFGAVVTGYGDASVLGIHRAGGQTILNPPATTVVEDGDRIVLLAHDSRLITWEPETRAVSRSFEPGPRRTFPVEHVAVFGWSRLGTALVRELDGYLPDGSAVTVIVDPTLVDGAGLAQTPLGRTRLEVHEISGPEHAGAIAEMSARCDHAVILCYRDALQPDDADARALLTMLQVREAAARAPGRTTPLNVVTELLDARDVRLVPRRDAGEFIVSERLVSLLLTQLAENPALQGVFDELLDPEGSEVYCAPASYYTAPGEEVLFGEVVARALETGELVLGYRRAADAADSERDFGLALNPPKSRLVRLDPDDQVVVLAEQQP